MGTKKIIIIITLALTGWALCGATIGIGRALTTMETTLIIHALAAPVIFAIISILYFRKYAYTGPLKTAVIFAGIVMIMDAGLVAPLFEGSYDMFKSLLGTWIPFALIFFSTYFTGRYFVSKGLE